MPPHRVRVCPRLSENVRACRFLRVPCWAAANLTPMNASLRHDGRWPRYVAFGYLFLAGAAGLLGNAQEVSRQGPPGGIECQNLGLPNGSGRQLVACSNGFLYGRYQGELGPFDATEATPIGKLSDADRVEMFGDQK